MTVLLVAAGAAVGAPLRYLVDRAVRARVDSPVPWGTLLVNTVGSFLLGLLAGSGSVSPGVVALVGTGFCGALTTYSTLSWETLTLAEGRRLAVAAAYLLGTTALGLTAAALGWWIG